VEFEEGEGLGCAGLEAAQTEQHCLGRGRDSELGSCEVLAILIFKAGCFRFSASIEGRFWPGIRGW
jgi:hypothetical protein